MSLQPMAGPPGSPVYTYNTKEQNKKGNHTSKSNTANMQEVAKIKENK